jgi:hypothetical protein
VGHVVDIAEGFAVPWLDEGIWETWESTLLLHGAAHTGCTGDVVENLGSSIYCVNWCLRFLGRVVTVDLLLHVRW